ncbi:MAG TPA: isoleucine--tRNA ligase [Bacteroidota bacterium]|nr:isoleucine--tRNA ligase [Bacteroidota bacterium]
MTKALFKELTDKVNYPQLELDTLKFWRENKVFEKSISSRSGRPGFTFYEGPPTANGRPGIHHVISRTLKDLVCRYKTMCGYRVNRKAGWDTHGLPVEIEVEKALGFKHKDDILKFGVAKFNEECRKSVWKYKSEWENLTERMGYWVDLAHPYITFTNEYIESVWWSLKRYFDGGLIYKGYKIQPYCPRCETPLSSHEVSLGYENVKDPSVYVKVRMKGEEDCYFLVWTTTPWTLVSNIALAVHPEVEYVKVKNAGVALILAEARLPVLEGEYEVTARMKGKSLKGKEYERLYNYHQTGQKAFMVVEADFVTTEDGTGIVHIAPAYGEEDYQVSKKHGLPTIHAVNKSGEFGPEVTDFAGMFVKDADPLIIQDLKARHLLYKKETITHSYPHCWRCQTPLLYYARDSWYIGTTTYAGRMMELNKTIHWYPPEVGEGRFGNWLAENKDWSLSRDRFWGTPLPIWICLKCSAQKCVGSIDELKQGSGVREPLDLHKPFIDEVTFTCACGGEMRRTPELIDVWFDSGAMPFAQWHYPFENKETFAAQHPADYICEGIDQTRGWFYSLHAISVFLFDRPASKNILVNELVLDKQGQKMSKSRGNTVDPFRILDTYGADATRWYSVASSPPWRPTLFDEDGLGEVQRKFFGTLLNTYAFFSLYANIDRFDGSAPPIPVGERAEIDRWILSALHSLIKKYRSDMDSYEVTRAARAVTDFTIDQLSNWYVRRNRRRFWKSEMGPDKTAAYQTLHECLVSLTKLMAPIAPFIAEELFRDLNAVAKKTVESVHLSEMPEADDRMIDLELESRMDKALRIVSLVRAIRNKSNLKVRQPLKRVILPVASAEDRQAVSRVEHMILDEINVKKIEYVDDDSEIVRKSAKPNFRSLGPKFGKSVQAVAGAIRKLTPEEIREMEKKGSLTLHFNSTEATITREDVDILQEEIKGWIVESHDNLTVALDTELTEDLIDEGYAREFVNRVQHLRKEAGLLVTDRIRISFRADGSLRKALAALGAYVKSETLAVEIVEGGPAPRAFAEKAGSAEVEINGAKCSIEIERVKEDRRK